MLKPMRQELTVAGFHELKTVEDVDAWDGHRNATGLLVINSVCGCAAGMARPGVLLALDNSEAKPAYLGTVFAGQDQEATARARGLFPQVPPSSPSMALFKDGELVFFLPRHRIEGRTAEQVADDLQDAFTEHCG
ncbi:MAG: BrxA/BrxB family bacilliredoxin [Thermoanaerobaculia bacterium]|nr:BrxA/BrxB family bacilliredoxin [Thermoanaerobaculia bacterium]